MKKIIIPLAFVCVSFASYAQVQRKVPDSLHINGATEMDENGAGEGLARKNGQQNLLKELNLTREQKLKIRER